MPALNDLATMQFDETRTYSEVVHFVHIYVPEPHPMTDPSPYTGSLSERAYSTRRQPTNYESRVDLARETDALLKGERLMLIDEKRPKSRANPVWCSYGPMPNTAYVIATDGTLRIVQMWENVEEIKEAIDQLLK